VTEANAPDARSVLVVEDHVSLRHALARHLRRAGWIVETTGTAGEAMERIARGSFDAVVVDLQLPDRSGREVVAFCTETRPDTAVVVVTGYATLEEATSTLRLGARDFVTKPFAAADLLAILERETRAPRTGDDSRLRARVERDFAPGALARFEEVVREVLGQASGDAARAQPLPIDDARRRFEARYLEDLLVRTRGNVAAAARIARISRPKMHAKLDSAGLDPRRFRPPRLLS
jgi:DNA-binding NtrC family response regulator